MSEEKNDVYRGDPNDWQVTKNGRVFSPARSLRVFNHSPCGFAWGYGGSGPAQLALALLLDVLGDEKRALGLYQSFKWKVIAGLVTEGEWELTSEQIMEYVDELEAQDDRQHRG